MTVQNYAPKVTVRRACHPIRERVSDNRGHIEIWSKSGTYERLLLGVGGARQQP
jgi:hypothetical protein